MMAQTLNDKLWDAHIVDVTQDGRCLIYIDRHLIHEVTSPQAFNGIELAQRKLWRRDSILAVSDHNVPTKDRESGIKDPVSRTQVETLNHNCHKHNLTEFAMHDERQGIVHIIGPEQGITLPGMTIVCGDSHTSTHGALGALAFGIGTSEVEHVLVTQCLILKKSKNFYYIDHGYLASSRRTFIEGSTVVNNLDGYFRVVKNDYIKINKGRYDSKRLDKLNINFKPERKSGDFIILSEPSKYLVEFFKLDNWIYNTTEELEKYTDRKIIVHNKQSKMPLDNLLKKAWAFVSFQSAAGFKAMIRGVPAHFTYDSLKNINSIKNIEKGIIDYQIFNNMAYSQWTLKEFNEGKMMDYI